MEAGSTTDERDQDAMTARQRSPCQRFGEGLGKLTPGM